MPAMLTATVKSKRGAACWRSSPRRFSPPSSALTYWARSRRATCELHPGGEHTGDVYGDEGIHGVEAREQHDQRRAGAFANTVCAHVHRRLGSSLGCLGQRRVEELVAGSED